jgi:NADH-quinone oxidoreductase subunit K
MSLGQVLFAGVVLILGVGLYGLLAGRHLIKVIIALQILVKATLLAIIVAGNVTGQVNLAQSIALTVIIVDTIAVVLALALAVQIKRRTGNLDAAELARLRH